MPQVAIPATHFTHSVKKNYQEHQSALIREFLQNSVDAGSSHISFLFDKNDRTLAIIDNGCGMSKDVLISALLTMSGTYKGENSIGGFGAAKEILLFQHHNYKVSTRKDGITTTVMGHQLEYDFIDDFIDDYMNGDGTVFIIAFHDDYNLESFEDIAIEYLHDCEVVSEISWNHELIDSHKKCHHLIDKNIDWADVYAKEVDSSIAVVRINGVKMFSLHISSDFEIIIEVTKPSTEILTVNRDGFSWAYQKELTDLVCQMAIDKGQFGKAFNQHKLWHGHNSSYEGIEFNFDDLLDDPEYTKYNTVFSDIAAKLTEFVSSNQRIDEIHEFVNRESNYSLPDKLIDELIAKAHDNICDHFANFYIKVTGIGINKIPDHLIPGNWGKRTTSLAKLWKHCLKVVMKANHISLNYAIGWVIDHNTQAMHMVSDGINVFYMNPTLSWIKSTNHNNTFMKLIINACHEIAHVNNSWHDEHFSLSCENMILKTMCYLNKTGNSWWKEYLASKNEVI